MSEHAPSPAEGSHLEGLVEQLAQRVAELVCARLDVTRPVGSPWLDFTAASTYLGFSSDRLYKLTAARAIPCRKKDGGQGLIFHKAELDNWMDTAYPRHDRHA